MLFAGWEVRMVKNCDRGLENAFSSPRSQFFTIRTELSRQITCLFFFPAVNWLYRLQMGLFTQLLSFNGLARRLGNLEPSSLHSSSSSSWTSSWISS